VCHCERVDDIPLLVEYLIDRYAQAVGKKIRNINKGTLDLFQTYNWPGNVRELQNVIERAVILSDGETFCVDETWLTPVTPKTAATSVPLVANLVEREREMIKKALREAEGADLRPGRRRHQTGHSQADARIKDQETGY
jgi:formate hydrogenlyase transcriptional activator